MSIKQNFEPRSAITSKGHGILNKIQTPAQVKASFTTDGKVRTRDVTALWDTGAQMSVISCALANDMKLVPVGKITVRGVNGTKIVNQYNVTIIIWGKVFVTLKVAEGDLHHKDGAHNSNTEVLIGMDLISLGDLAVNRYTLPDRKFATQFSFRIPSKLDPIDYVVIENRRTRAAQTSYVNNHRNYKSPKKKKSKSKRK